MRLSFSKLFGLFAIALLSAWPARAAYTLLEGQGTVTQVTGLGGAQPTGAVAIGDTFRFFFGFNPASAPRVFDGGSSFQVFAPDIIGVLASAGDFEFAFGGSSSLALGTGFRLFPGEAVSTPVLNQSWSLSGAPFGNLPFAATPLEGSVSLSLTSTFRQDLGGATPSFSNLRDPREAVTNRFRISVRERGTTLGFVDGDFTGGFLVSSVPEPSTWAIMILGFGAVGVVQRASKRKRSPAVA